MELHHYMEEGHPFTGRRLSKLTRFLAEQGLRYDSHISYSLLLYDQNGHVIGTGSRDQNVLKCLAVSSRLQGEGLMNTVMTKLLSEAFQSGYHHLFLFTKPQYLNVFRGLDFYPIIQTPQVLFMENIRDGIQGYLQKETKRFEIPPHKRTGAIVMNANPFTLGHRHLIQEARKDCDVLHVFVLSSQDTCFPPGLRLELVQKGCEDFDQVFVHGGSEYLISHATFPDYFHKDEQTAQKANGNLDLQIFCRYFKEAFHIDVRYVGEEPFCGTTAAYNRQMLQLLPAEGIEVKVLPRLAHDGLPISATQVRAYYKEQNWEALRPLVPESTYEALRQLPV